MKIQITENDIRVMARAAVKRLMNEIGTIIPAIHSQGKINLADAISDKFLEKFEELGIEDGYPVVEDVLKKYGFPIAVSCGIDTEEGLTGAGPDDITPEREYSNTEELNQLYEKAQSINPENETEQVVLDGLQEILVDCIDGDVDELQDIIRSYPEGELYENFFFGSAAADNAYERWRTGVPPEWDYADVPYLEIKKEAIEKYDAENGEDSFNELIYTTLGDDKSFAIIDFYHGNMTINFEDISCERMSRDIQKIIDVIEYEGIDDTMYKTNI